MLIIIIIIIIIIDKEYRSILIKYFCVERFKFCIFLKKKGNMLFFKTSHLWIYALQRHRMVEEITDDASFVITMSHIRKQPKQTSS